jgi:hypothetical protein
MIILLVIAVTAVVAPVIGVVLLSLAIRREDAALSLSGRPSGAMQAAARRLVGFHGDGIGTRPGSARSDWAGRDGGGTGDGHAGDLGLRGDFGYTGDGFTGDGWPGDGWPGDGELAGDGLDRAGWPSGRGVPPLAA